MSRKPEEKDEEKPVGALRLDLPDLREVLGTITEDKDAIEEALTLAVAKSKGDEDSASLDAFCHSYCLYRKNHEGTGLPEECEACPIAAQALHSDELEELGLAEPEEEERAPDPADPRRKAMRGVRAVGEAPRGPSRRARSREIQELNFG